MDKKILWIWDEGTPVGWYRKIVPARALQEKGYDITLKSSFNYDDIDKCDIFIPPRLGLKEIQDAVYYARSRKKEIILDVDDDLWNLHPTSTAYQVYVKQVPTFIPIMTKLIKLADKLTTTTEYLANILKQYNNNIVIIPNYLPSQYWHDYEIKPRENDSLVIGWAGTFTHYIDLQEVAGILNQILDTYPNVEIHMASVRLDWFPSHKRLKLVDSVQVENYATLLSSFDIGIAPLADIKFNYSKSDLKVLEFAAVGVPTIASNLITYNKSVQQGVTGYLANNNKDWLKYFKTLIENDTLRTEMGKTAQLWAETRMIEKHIDKWEKLFKED